MRWRTLKKRQKAPPSPPKIEYDRARFRERALGFATDLFMIGIPVSVVMMLFFGHDQMHTAGAMDVIVHNHDKAPPSPVSSIAQIVLMLIAYVGLWHRDGQTPGKRLTHTRVVDAITHQEASYWKLVLRFLGYFISLIPFGLGYALAWMRTDGRALHDLLSGTMVIRDR